ncbi:hypothetical protein FOA43_004342 [Brettanomyces nanus]|uniref:Signal recognition particle SEC65 subunit n=1 Tax=Eeniella nana TaxID=13502 RepID=A0A875S7M0_EENNA|nr:uncharacterized protein FOA43_004342 [Brettanomyces nanus]QPG76948.1 hypothetical protein FOA43_004342 [Brettanomyces nanus]
MPQIEEISDAEDIDNLDLDIAEFDPDLVTPVAPRYEDNRGSAALTSSSKPQMDAADAAMAELLRRSNEGIEELSDTTTQRPERPERPENPRRTEDLTDEERKQLSTMQSLYPCYFDSNRSVKEGRRAPIEKCVENPLANTILNACRSFGFPALLESDKSHPQDFGNPGRVRLALKFEEKPTHKSIRSKRQLLNEVGDYLLKHPTTLDTVKEMPGPPELTQGSYQPTKVPKVLNFKMNTIVPLHSPLTMKNPQTASAYTKLPPPQAAQQMKRPKQKIQRIRG